MISQFYMLYNIHKIRKFILFGRGDFTIGLVTKAVMTCKLVNENIFTWIREQKERKEMNRGFPFFFRGISLVNERIL